MLDYGNDGFLTDDLAGEISSGTDDGVVALFPLTGGLIAAQGHNAGGVSQTGVLNGGSDAQSALLGSDHNQPGLDFGMTGDHGGSAVVGILHGGHVVNLVGAVVENTVQLIGHSLLFTLGTGDAGGGGVHGHVQNANGLVFGQVVLGGVVRHPLTGGVADVVGVNAEPGSQLVVVAVLQRIVAGNDDDTGSLALGDNGLGHGLVGDAGNDGVGIVRNGGVNLGHVLFCVTVAVQELPFDFDAVLGALVVQSLLNGGGFVDEVGGLGLVDTVNVQRSGGSGCFLGGSLGLDGGGGFSSLGFGGGFLCATGSQGQNHHQSQEQSNQLFHCVSSVLIIYVFRQQPQTP